MRKAQITTCLALASAIVGFQTTRQHAYVPANGFVPDSATATRIAVAVWIPIYGEQTIANERPYSARLEHGTWIVEGSLPRNMNVGGVALAAIAKKDGRVLRVTHGK
jgi:hypothetical protein